MRKKRREYLIAWLAKLPVKDANIIIQKLTNKSWIKHLQN